MLTLIIFILILSLLIFVHEFGHYISAKRKGIKVEEFGFGFPPRIFGFKGKDNTIYSINWIPLGGFVKIKGEAGERREDSDSFASRRVSTRALILFAGVAMNIILAAGLFTVGFIVGTPQAIGELSPFAKVKDERVQIISILPESPAEGSGLKPGDVVLSIDDTKSAEPSVFSEIIKQAEGKKLEIRVRRQETEHTFEVIPQKLSSVDYPAIGVSMIKVGIVSYPPWLALWKGIEITGIFLLEIVKAFGILIGGFITKGKLVIDLSGPVGIAVLTGEVARLGLIYLLQFTALLSLNLAVINILPFPALDGGRLLFLGIEKAKGKPVSKKVENLIHQIGFLLLIFLVIIVTFRDISRFGDRIWSIIRKTLPW